MKPIRIALVITELDWGGAERYLVDLAVNLDRARFEPTVYSLAPRPEDGAASCVPPLEAAEIDVHCLGANGARDFFKTVRRLTALFREHRPDVVQTNLFHANIIGRLAAHRAGIRNVICGNHIADRDARWRHRVDRWTGRYAAKHVCVSESVARFTEKYVGHPREKLIVIPNVDDPSKYPPQCQVEPVDRAEFGFPPTRHLMTFVGRLHRQKGLDRLLSHMSDWSETLPDWDVLLVGEGPEREALQRIVAEHRLEHRVHFAGWRPDVREILAATDLMILPSRWEGMPSVVLHAMCSSLPVLSTEVEGVQELLGAAGDEQIVPSGDAEAWTEQLVRLASNEALRHQLGQANRERAVEHFSIDVAVRMYQDAWESLLEP